LQALLSAAIHGPALLSAQTASGTFSIMVSMVSEVESGEMLVVDVLSPRVVAALMVSTPSPPLPASHPPIKPTPILYRHQSRCHSTRPSLSTYMKTRAATQRSTPCWFATTTLCLHLCIHQRKNLRCRSSSPSWKSPSSTRSS
jgi:hypothetical protein